ncbi:MAG: hypothetical protein H7223_01115 [Pedobacter sp.]|nr:hypothetical protein [Pedobacter sp.]
MKKFTIKLRTCLSGLFCLFLMAFSIPPDLLEDTAFIQKMLKDHYDEIAIKPALKRYELNVTNSGFCRYKRFYTSGKVEYFSFNLTKFAAIDYYGTDKAGDLLLRTLGDDVIVQTYNDRQGDVDSMASYMAIPLKNVEAEQLSELAERLVKMNAHLLAQK